MSTNTYEPFGGQVHVYPCNRGMGGAGVGYHEFVHSGGVTICRYCGKSPEPQPIRITCGIPAVSCVQIATVAGGVSTL